MEKTAHYNGSGDGLILFGNSRRQTIDKIRIWLMVCGLAEFCLLFFSHSLLESVFYSLFFIVPAWWWLSAIFAGAEELCFDVERGIYTCQKGFRKDGFHSGYISDIDHIKLYQEIVPEKYSNHQDRVAYVSCLVFRQEKGLPPLYFRGLYEPKTPEQFEAQITHLLQVANRLNLPIQDYSGWRGAWRSISDHPEGQIINPGETHPAHHLPPPKKW